jgi:hypothetical protein
LAQKRIYFVCGGVFADGKLDRLETDAKPECYGPFDDEETAIRVCEQQNRRNVDICWHHLYITSCLTPG